MIKENLFERIAVIAYESLVEEVKTTPKPGLVDQDNNGAHLDMTLQTFLDSAGSLYSYFRDSVKIGSENYSDIKQLLEKLRPLGKKAEKRMYMITNGVNTHKGAIFSMGIFCSAAGVLLQSDEKLDLLRFSEVCREICCGLTEEFHSLAFIPENSETKWTHGEKLYLQYGVTGIRGEAEQGFPLVFSFAYPLFQEYKKQGFTSRQSGACTLLHLISKTQDTNLITRMGYEKTLFFQEKLRGFLKEASPEAILAVLKPLDAFFIREHISPGGCADLLALTYFLDFVFRD